MLPEAFSGHPPLTAIWILTYAVCLVPEIFLSRRMRSSTDAQHSDRGSKLVVILAANLAVVVGFAAAIACPQFTLAAHWRLVFAAGIATWIGGSLFRWYAMRVLGRFFTFDVAVSAGQHVIESGPYRWIRHPAYLGSLLGELGFGITLTNSLAMFLPVLCLGLAYAYRIPIEEKALQRGLGPSYSEYMRRTWRLVPLIF